MDLLRKTAFIWSVFLSILLLEGGSVPPFEDGSFSPPTTSTYLLSVQLNGSTPEDAIPAGVEVSAARLEQDGDFTTPTKLEGHAPRWQQRLEPGRYLLVVHAPGRVRIAEFVDLDQDRQLSFALDRAVTRTIEVMQHTDGELLPLVGATVLLSLPSELPFGTLTDERGKATFTEVPEGEMVVRVYAPGFEPYRAVTSGDLLVRLRPVRALRVHVARQGVPTAGATVWISGLSLWPARAVQTGPKGYVDITGLSSGSYTVSAELEGDVSEETRVELLPGPGLEEVRFALLPGTFVTVRVVDEDEHPIEGAHVTHTRAGLGGRAHRAPTDAAGLVKLGPLREQTGQLQVHAAGYLPTVADVLGDNPQQIRLSPSGVVTGRVVDSRGRPVSAATIEIVGTDIQGMPVAMSQQLVLVEDAHFRWATSPENVLLPAGELGVLLGPVPSIPLDHVSSIASGEQLTTDDKGRFRAGDVPPGRLLVIARHPDHMDGKTRPFDLAPGGKRDVEVVLGTGLPLSGRVVDDRGFPVERARVRVTGQGFERQLLAEKDGTFSLAAAPSEVRIRISRSETPLSVLLEVPVGKKERNDEVLLELPPPRAPVEVSVRDPDGKPIALAQVSITSLLAEIPTQMTRFSDRDGQVRFDQASDLLVRLEATAPGFVQKNQELRLGRTLSLSLKPSIDVGGRVTGVRGRTPAVGARVSLSVGGVTRGAVTNELGEYELRDVPPGRGVLGAEHPELGQASSAVLVAPGVGGRKGSLPDLDLVPPASVRGVVVDRKGNTIGNARLSLDRISAYLLPGGGDQGVGVSDGAGRFALEVDMTEARYLFAAKPAEAFGFSEPLTEKQLEGQEEVTVLLDRRDAAEPDERATVLISLEAQRGGLVIYAVGPRSSAERAGLRREDRLLTVDGKSPETVPGARRLLSGRSGSDVLLTFLRGSQEKTARVRREAFAR